jgi:tetratricopeptide (TPR) repeat protein
MGLDNIACVYQAQGNYSQALALLEKALQIRERLLPSNHPDIALGLNKIAVLHDTQGDCAKAVALFERTLKVYELSYGPKHPSTKLIRENLALCRDKLHLSFESTSKSAKDKEKRTVVKQTSNTATIQDK